MSFRVHAIVLLLVAAVLQVSLGYFLSIRGARPDLVFIAVYGLSVAGGEGRGMFYGALGGLIEDCLSGGFIGLMLSGYAIVGFLAGRLAGSLFNIGESANFLGMLVLGLAQSIYTAVVLGTFLGDYDILGGLLRHGVPQSLYTAAAGALLLWMVDESTADRHSWSRLLRRVRIRM
jgi:rod shape-determining protein MreD